jgi:hypothetical protein
MATRFPASVLRLDDQGRMLGPNGQVVLDVPAAQALVDGSGLTPASGHAQRLLNKLRTGIEDAAMLIAGDSTGNEPQEWVYLLSDWIASQYPAYTVKWRVWDEVAKNYGAEAVIRAGTGAKVLTVWNASVPGARVDYFNGDKYPNAVEAIGKVDLVMFSYGHNGENSAVRNHNIALRFLEFIEPVLVTHQGCGVIAVAQNPERDNTDSDGPAQDVRDICALRGFGLADVWWQFTSRGKAASLYSDSRHPSPGLGTASNPSGTRLFVETVKTHFIGKQVAHQAPQSLLLSVGESYIENGEFTTWTNPNSAPDGWTLVGATAQKDTTVKFGKNGYSLKLTSTGSGGSYIDRPVSAGALETLKGSRVVVAVACRKPAGAPTTGTRPTLVHPPVASTNYLMFDGAFDRFKYQFLSAEIVPSMTGLSVRINCDTATSTGVVSYIGGVWLCRGLLPHC